MDLILPDFANPGVWVSLLTLCFLEVVLGIDNIIFISIISSKLPEAQQRLARNAGLLMAMGFRLGLLFAISWFVSLRYPVITVPAIMNLSDPLPLTWRDLILLGGGIFLIVKSTLEIHSKLGKDHDLEKQTVAKTASLSSIILQIVLIDAVFSFDSILTAVGLVDNVVVMMIAVVFSIVIMMLFAGPVMRIINQHPTLQMLALSFLIVIGVVLVAGGLHQEVSKSIIYSCLGFSLGVELLNIRLRKKSTSA